MPLLFSSSFSATFMVKQYLFYFYLPVLLCTKSDCAYGQKTTDPSWCSQQEKKAKIIKQGGARYSSRILAHARSYPLISTESGKMLSLVKRIACEEMLAIVAEASVKSFPGSRRKGTQRLQVHCFHGKTKMRRKNGH